MVETDVIVNFNYEGSPTTVQGTSEQTMDEMCRNFEGIFSINQNDVYYLYNGNVINRDNTFNDIVNINDRERGETKVVVMKSNEEEEDEKKDAYLAFIRLNRKRDGGLDIKDISVGLKSSIIGK